MVCMIMIDYFLKIILSGLFLLSSLSKIKDVNWLVKSHPEPNEIHKSKTNTKKEFKKIIVI